MPIFVSFVMGPKDAYFFNSPTHWAWRNLPPDVEALFTKQPPIKDVIEFALGERGAYFVSYRDHDGEVYCRHYNLPNPLITYLYHSHPRIIRNLPTLSLTLGPWDSYYAHDATSASWSNLPSPLEKALEHRLVSQDPWKTTWKEDGRDAPSFVSLGADGSYFMRTVRGGGSWELKGREREEGVRGVDGFLEGVADFGGVAGLYLFPHHPACYILLLTSGKAFSNLPEQTWEDYNKMAPALPAMVQTLAPIPCVPQGKPTTQPVQQQAQLPGQPQQQQQTQFVPQTQPQQHQQVQYVGQPQQQQQVQYVAQHQTLPAQPQQQAQFVPQPQQQQQTQFVPQPQQQAQFIPQPQQQSQQQTQFIPQLQPQQHPQFLPQSQPQFIPQPQPQLQPIPPTQPLLNNPTGTYYTTPTSPISPQQFTPIPQAAPNVVHNPPPAPQPTMPSSNASLPRAGLLGVGVGVGLGAGALLGAVGSAALRSFNSNTSTLTTGGGGGIFSTGGGDIAANDTLAASNAESVDSFVGGIFSSGGTSDVMAGDWGVDCAALI